MRESYEGYVTIDRGNFSKYQERVKKYYEYLNNEVRVYDDFYRKELVREAKLKYENLSFLGRLFSSKKEKYIRKYQESNNFRNPRRMGHRGVMERWYQAEALIGCLRDRSIGSIQIPLWFNSCLRWFEGREEKKNE